MNEFNLVGLKIEDDNLCWLFINHQTGLAHIIIVIDGDLIEAELPTAIL